jgi:uncharacterized protein YhdP
MTPKTIVLTKNVDATKYANIETGELLSSEMPENSQTKIDVLTERKKMEFEDYVCSDTLIDEHMMSILDPIDYVRYRFMACRLHTDVNMVLARNNRPHTLQSLSKELEISRDETTRLIRRLKEHGLATWAEFPELGHLKKVLVFNPNAIKKRTGIYIKLLPLFQNFKELKTAPKPAPPKKRVKKSNPLQVH